MPPPTKQQPGFLPFLPADNEAGSNAVEFCSADCLRLLELPYPAYAQAMLQDASLRAFLDSFLQHRRRGFDSEAWSPDVLRDEQGNPTELDSLTELTRRVFLVLYRLVAPEESAARGLSGA